MVDADQARLAEFLGAGQPKVLDQWTEAAGRGVSDRISPAELRRELAEILSLTVAVQAGQGEATAGPRRAGLQERSRARYGFSPRETAATVLSLKEAVYSQLADSVELLPAYLGFTRFVDDLGLQTFEAFVGAREQIIADQAESMLELSTPVVRLWDGIIAVPLVGTLDSARTQLVMEKMLEALVATEAEHAVIDITGVPTVDTEVAQHLLKTVVAARLMGADCIITGIRPQIAYTIVSLGIEFGDVLTKQTLADGLAHALSRSGLKVVPA